MRQMNSGSGLVMGLGYYGHKRKKAGRAGKTGSSIVQMLQV